MNNIYFVSGIDTDAGKSYVTGWMARLLMEQGKSVVTQKFIQTGNSGMSEDIEVHRRIMGTGPLDVDTDGITAPIIFSYPASAQLAARIDGREIDLSLVDKSAEYLASRFDIVFVEGAGGLMVPVTDDYFTIDYVAERHLPLILVTNGVLGSINHTILSLEAIRSRGIELAAVIYNTHFDSDAVIAADTCDFLRRYLHRHFPSTVYAIAPEVG